MNMGRMTWLTWPLLACAILVSALAATVAFAQLPNIGSMLPDKTQLLVQAQKLVTELTAMKSSGKLNAADTSKVDSLLPKATAVNTELAKPEVQPSRLTQLAGQLGDLQKQMATLRGSAK